MANDDAELLALGARLQKIADEWIAQMARDRTEDAAHNAKVELLTGIAAHEAPPYNAAAKKSGEVRVQASSSRRG